jgi:hypothetical protein
MPGASVATTAPRLQRGRDSETSEVVKMLTFSHTGILPEYREEHVYYNR